MLAIVAPYFCEPSKYELIELPLPTVKEPTDVIINVFSSSVNPVDVKKAAGAFKVAIKEEFPYQIGYDCAGTVIEIGENVSNIKVGDEVYARFPEANRGTWSEHARCAERFVALKPKNLSFDEAASVPLAALTALQAFKRYNGSLAGKTVFVPAGLSGTGSYACQLAKNVFKAGKVITTVSTPKVSKIPVLLGEGVVDQVIDYTTEDLMQAIPLRSVDFILDTTGQAMQFLSLMTQSNSLIISISTMPSGAQLQSANVMDRADKPQVPWYAYHMLNIMDSIRKIRARRWNVQYSYMFLSTNNEDLRALTTYIERGILKPIVGSSVDFQNIGQVKESCQTVFDGKGGIGKTMLKIG